MYNLTKNQEYIIRANKNNDTLIPITKEYNFGVIVNGKYTYFSYEAEKEGWTWKTKEKKNNKVLKVGEKPKAWHTTQYGDPFYLYKVEQFEERCN